MKREKEEREGRRGYLWERGGVFQKLFATHKTQAEKKKFKKQFFFCNICISEPMNQKLQKVARKAHVRV
jgi:hypothetical protein